MTLKYPKIKETPISKCKRVAKVIKANGKSSIFKIALLSGYSATYFRYNIVPSLLEFFEDIETDGTDIWCNNTPQTQEAVPA